MINKVTPRPLMKNTEEQQKAQPKSPIITFDRPAIWKDSRLQHFVERAREIFYQEKQSFQEEKEFRINFSRIYSHYRAVELQALERLDSLRHELEGEPKNEEINKSVYYYEDRVNESKLQRIKYAYEFCVIDPAMYLAYREKAVEVGYIDQRIEQKQFTHKMSIPKENEKDIHQFGKYKEPKKEPKKELPPLIKLSDQECKDLKYFLYSRKDSFHNNTLTKEDRREFEDMFSVLYSHHRQLEYEAVKKDPNSKEHHKSHNTWLQQSKRIQLAADLGMISKEIHEKFMSRKIIADKVDSHLEKRSLVPEMERTHSIKAHILRDELTISQTKTIKH